jgi:hypothetical protein
MGYVRLLQPILKIVREHAEAGMLPTSARFIYYKLIAGEVLSKERTGARRTDQDMIDALTILREREQIPWDLIEDETRELSDLTGTRPYAPRLSPVSNMPAWMCGAATRP